MTSLCLAENFKTRKTRTTFIKSDASCLINWVSLDFWFVLSGKHDESSLKAKAAKRLAKEGRGKREHLCSRRYKTSKWCVKFDNKQNTTSEAIKERAIAMGEGERESKKEGEAQPVNELMVRGHSMTWAEQITCYKFDMLMTSVRDSLGRLAKYSFFASSSSSVP